MTVLKRIHSAPNETLHAVFLSLNVGCIAFIIAAVLLFDTSIVIAAVLAGIGVLIFVSVVALVAIVAFVIPDSKYSVMK